MRLMDCEKKHLLREC